MYFTGKEVDLTAPQSVNEAPQGVIRFALQPPLALQFMKAVNFPSQLNSIAMHRNKMYTAQESSQLLEIENFLGNKQTGRIIGVLGVVSCVQVYEEQLYVAAWAQNQLFIKILDMTGHEIRSWSHGQRSSRYNMIRVLSAGVVVPCETEGALCVCSFTGDLLKTIKCPVSKGGWKAMAKCGNNSVIVSDWGHHEGVVFRVDIDSGAVMWTYKRIQCPEGVVCYKDRYVLVSNYNSATRIWILDINTGEPTSPIHSINN